ncbi:unnamed protein product [Urochloa humidicola]
MEEIVGSAVASEAVSRVSSFLLGDKTSHEGTEDKAERLEMAVLKIRSVVAVSEDLHVSHLPLLHWKAKLKRIAEEGDDLLHMRKKRALDCSRVSDSTTGNSISQYLIQAAKRFVHPFGRKEHELSDNTVRRFERLADGAANFFRLVQSSDVHPERSVFLPSLTRSLLGGDSLEFIIQRESGDDHIMLWPWLDPDTERGLVAWLCVAREEVLLRKIFKLCVLFRISEASNILAIAMSSLEHLPAQFDSASAAIRRLLIKAIEQSSQRSNFSERSIWCSQRIQSYHLNDCESSTGDKHRDRGTAILSLPQSVLRITSYCYASPYRKDGLPIKLEYHVSPHLLPEKHSNQFERVEQGDIRKLLPKVTDGFYDDERQDFLHYKRQIWCPQSSTYCSVAPAISQPLTMAQAYLMECSGTLSRRRRAKRKSRSISKLKEIAKA